MTDQPRRLVIFALDNTLIDRAGAFRIWASVFVADRALGGQREIEWLQEADSDGLTPRTTFRAHPRSKQTLE